MVSTVPSLRKLSLGLRDDDATESTLWAYAILVLVLDVALTVVGLERGHAELNPVARTAMVIIGPVAAMLLLKLFAVTVAIVGRWFLPRDYHVVAPIALAVPWTVAVGVNAMVLA
ncbi:MAG: DUF5658 family protein [Haloferacaceae archaeon]